MIFISCSFDPFSKSYGETVRSLFQQYGVDAYIAEHPAPGALPDVLKSYVKQSDALVALVTDQESPWQQTEITWANEFNTPIYGIVQEGVAIRGLLPYVTKYQTFSLLRPETLQKAIEKIVYSISEMKKKKQQQQQGLLIAGLAILGLYILSQNK